MKNSFKFLASAAALASTFAFVACGDDSSTSASSSSDTQTGSISVNEAEQTLTATATESQDLCLVNGGAYSWTTLKESYSTTFKYIFVGDTLVLRLYDDEDEKFRNDGNVYIGGTANSVYGSWQELRNCEWEHGNIECDDDDYSYDLYLTITKSSFTAKRVPRGIVSEDDYNDYYTDDYMKSELMRSIYVGLYTGSFSISTSDIFYRDENLSDPNANVILASEFGVTIQSQSKTSETFTMNGQTVKVNVSKASISDAGDEKQVNMSVDIDGTSCVLDYQKTDNITKSLCKAENAEYFETDYDYDENDNKYYYVDEYYKSNRDAFKTCMEILAEKTISVGKIDIPDYDIPDIYEILYDSPVYLYKKAANTNADRKARQEKFHKILEKFAE